MKYFKGRWWYLYTAPSFCEFQMNSQSFKKVIFLVLPCFEGKIIAWSLDLLCKTALLLARLARLKIGITCSKYAVTTYLHQASSFLDPCHQNSLHFFVNKPLFSLRIRHISSLVYWFFNINLEKNSNNKKLSRYLTQSDLSLCRQ